MLNQRLTAARLVADKLLACENAIDDALISVAELTSATPQARRVANVSPIVGSDAMALVGEAMAALHLARAKMVQAHGAYAGVRDELSIPTRLGGDLWKIAQRANGLRVIGVDTAEVA